ncbi:MULTISPECIES: Ig-like domain-containing protein [unclassified Novosphingobium]|uniref:Ig-like domain-containing protein n=1 Tax=unclassified Novosphingobium TaxID=2644732 RepID=UPI00135CF2DA|nr:MULTISPECIES: Ig-like domain-containing protein [unclassified Novosphingobium]
MPVAAKISSTTAGINSAPIQAVEGTVAIPTGGSVALNLPPATVEGYTREGADLLVHLKSGEVVRIANFYFDPTRASQLLLVQEDELVAADVSQAASGSLSSTTYVPMDATAGFQAAGAEVAGAAAGASGAGLGAGAIIPLAVLGGAGVVAAAAGGGGGGNDTPVTPPDTTSPSAATKLAINAAGTSLTGSAEAGATIIVDIDGNGTIDYSATVGANGTFTVILSPPLLDGETVSVTVRNVAGNVSPATVVTAPDTTAPRPAGEVAISADGTSLTGTGDPGNTVTVDINGDEKPDFTAEIGAGGNFVILFTVALDNGQKISVSITDPSGNTSAAVVITAPDLSPPPTTAPVIDPSNGTLFTGTAQSGVGVVLIDAAGNPVGQAVIGADGTWSITLQTPLPDGTVVTAAAINDLGEAGPGATVIVDALAPAAPVIAPSNGTSISGMAESGATVLLFDVNGNPIGQSNVDAGGAWSFTLTTPLTDGTVVYATGRDGAGNTGPQASVTIDAVPPPIPTIIPSNGAAISGTAEAGSTVILTDGNGNTIAQVTADDHGNWSFAPASPFADGTVINATARDAAGNTGDQASATVDAAPPPEPTIAPSNGEALAGTAEAGATIILTDGDGNPIAQFAADDDGNWSFSPAVPLPDGTVVNAVAADSVGNASQPASITVDSIPPAAPLIDPTNGSVISGSAETGALVTLTDGDENVIGQAIADDNGVWIFTPGFPLADGTVVHAAAQDATGNIGASASATVDGVPPPTPTIEPTNGTILTGTAEPGSTIRLTYDDGSPIGEATVDENGDWRFTPALPLPDGIVVNAQAQDAAGNSSLPVVTTIDAAAPAAPTIAASNGSAFSGTAEPDAIVTLTDGNGTPIGQTTADENGFWSVTPGSPLADGTVVNASAQDAAGNTGPQTSVTVDAFPPAPPQIDPSDGTELTGSAEAGALLMLTDEDGNTLGQVTVGIDGNWNFTPTSTLVDGSTVVAIAQDAAGNISDPSSRAIDSSPPVEPTINPTNGSVVTGTAEPNSTVILSDGTGNAFARSIIPNLGLPLGQVTADGEGNWTFIPLLQLPDGTMVIAISVDAAGNVSNSVSTTVDGVAPLTPTIDLTNGLMLAGTADPGVTIQLTNGLGASIGQTTADDDGNWTFTPLLQLGNGTLVDAVAVDEAGNVSPPASTIVDSIPPGIPSIHDSNGVILAGTAEPESTVILTNALGGTIAELVTDSSGNWSFTPAIPLANGTLVIAVAHDEVGNISAPANITIDSIPPGIPGLLLSSGGDLLTISAEPGSRVEIVIDGDSANTIIVNISLTGVFMLPLSPALILAETISAAATDAAGNRSPSSTIVAPDLTPPTVEVSEAIDGFVNAAEASNGIQVEVALRPTMQAGQAIIAHFNGQGGYQAQATHVLTSSDLLAGAVVLSIVPTAGLGAFPEGAATITGSVGSGGSSLPIAFTVDTIAPPTPVLMLSNNLLTISTAPGTELTINTVAGGTRVSTSVTADNNGSATLDLLTGLGAPLGWNQLLNTQLSVTGADPAGNTSNVTTIAVGPNIEQPVTVGNFALDVSLNPLNPRFGFTGTTEPNSTVEVRLITPALNLALLPVAADGSGHFSVNLLSTATLTHLGLNITDILNLGAEISFGVVSVDQQGNESAAYLLDLTPSGLSLNLGQIDVNGTIGDDVMAGTPTVEHINGGSGDDLILNVGSGDHVAAGPGDDTIQLTATNFVSVDGGTGFDTVLLANGIDLDYGVGVGAFTNVERIDLGTGDPGSTLTLTAPEITAITDANNALQITGESNDVLSIVGASDTGAAQTINGVVYDVYTFGANTVLVEDNTVQVLV